MGHRNCDIRPRLIDKKSGEARLLDSGSQITVTKKRPGDKIDNSIRLVAVNGTKIDTFGIREIEVKLGRKTYPMPAIICDVQQDILGMDFMTKFRLSMAWDDFDQTELLLVDKKSQIKQELQIITVPTDLPRVHFLDSSPPPASPASPVPPLSSSSSSDTTPQRSVDAESVAFQVSYMKKLSVSSVSICV